MEYSYGKDFQKKTFEERKAIAREANMIADTAPLKNPYGVLTEEAFAEKLDGMNPYEMQRLCIEIVASPTGTRTFLKSRLKASFAKFLSKNKLKIEKLKNDENN